MEIKNIQSIVEVKDRRFNNESDKWISLELNENDVDELERGSGVVGFTTAKGIKCLIVRVGK